MAKLYVEFIKKGDKTIDNVPSLWKAQVLSLLATEGLDGYGNPLENAE